MNNLILSLETIGGAISFYEGDDDYAIIRVRLNPKAEDFVMSNVHNLPSFCEWLIRYHLKSDSATLIAAIQNVIKELRTRSPEVVFAKSH